MGKYIYVNKETKEKIVTSEKLSEEHWELVREWRNGKIDVKKAKIIKK